MLRITHIPEHRRSDDFTTPHGDRPSGAVAATAILAKRMSNGLMRGRTVIPERL
jgi:hypothetical protein